ncbi:MAG: DUF3536 domain-containing protein [Verrucomicrobiota bacterium]
MSEPAPSPKYICLHGHFYQPPRENPWLEEIERQDSAYPFHDWNERITSECYSPNAAARIVDSGGRIKAIVNNYSSLSFNFGPTLLSWLEEKRPDVYQAILDADKEAMTRYDGHGSAIAQGYNHIILPLANTRDKITQVRWGLADFEARFGRPAEGMWMPETAVDLETLEIMADHGIKFTIMAPRQCHQVRSFNEEEWHDVSDARVDPRRAYLVKLPNGNEITAFFYDGVVSQDCAFGTLLHNGENFANRLMNAFDDHWDEGQLVHIAMDGETFGHHVPHADMTLAYAVKHIRDAGIEFTIYPVFMEKHPPQFEARIYENSSWSDVMGVERWRSGKGSCTGMHPGWQQDWRAPLRDGLDALRDKLALLYEKQSEGLFREPWAARDAYADVILDREKESVDKFFAEHATGTLTPEKRVEGLKLLEIQRNAMLMYTSCGWFFDEISGLETTQIMHYANCAMQLAKELTGQDFEPDFIEELRQAPSNIAEFENGAVIYERFSKPLKIDLLRVSVHFAVSSLFHHYEKRTKIFCYEVEFDHAETHEMGRQTLSMGTARLRSQITEENFAITYAVLHLGDHNIIAGVRLYMNQGALEDLKEELLTNFRKSDVPQVIRILDANFAGHIYGVWNLFKDEQERVLELVLEPTFSEMERAFDQIYTQNHTLMNVIHEAQVPTPTVFAATVEFLVNSKIKRLLTMAKPALDELESQIEEANRWKPNLNEKELSLAIKTRAQALLEAIANNPDDTEFLEYVTDFLDLISRLPMHIDLWEAQNIYFVLQRAYTPVVKKRADSGNATAEAWLPVFAKLGSKLYFKRKG